MSNSSFEQLLTGGHPNSLGNTEQVVEAVLDDPSRFDELFNCYFSDDEIVRLRTSSAMKRIYHGDKKLLLPYIDRFLEEISAIDQASAQWTLAQLFSWLKPDMDEKQKAQAEKILRRNLSDHHDWIVLNNTMETLADWSSNDDGLRKWLLPHLIRLSEDSRKSVANRATKWLKQFS